MKYQRFVRTLVFAVGVWALATLPVAADVPQLIRYQGTLADRQQVALEGPYTLTFRIYDAQSAGIKLWEEVQTGVPISKGTFSVSLGSVTPLEMAFDRDCWLSIQVADDPEMTPRVRLTSVPTAYRAEMAEKAIAAEALVNPITTSTITDDAKRLVPSGAIILWTGASCPAGYTRLSALDGALIKAGATYAAATASGTSELPAHTHGPGSLVTDTQGSHDHDMSVEKDTGGESALGSTSPNAPMANGRNYISHDGAHGHSVTSGTTASAGSGTVATLLFCQKD